MPTNSWQLHHPPFSAELPTQIYFRTALMQAASIYPQHHHVWGEFVYSFTGVMEVEVGEKHYLAPSQYGIWLPPNVEHRGRNRYEAFHCSLYISAELCTALPDQACALMVSPLIRAMLEHLLSHPHALPLTEKDDRLLRTLIDQLEQAECAGSYLPTTNDPLLGPVLRALENNPEDNRPLQELASAFNTTERTLMRRCKSELGMTLAQWRQRMRVLRALPMLEAGQTVETIAFDLGYSSASSFITMFRRLMNVTPDEYRKGALS